jgi:predicted DsbA family dithiol-disulfide isomerase
MSDLVEVVVDFVCPWCFVGKRKLDHALLYAQDADRYAVGWLPCDAIRRWQAQGVDSPSASIHSSTNALESKHE